MMTPFSTHALFAAILVSSAPEGPPPPAIDQVVIRLERSEAAIENLSVTTEWVKLQKFGLPVEVPVRTRETTKYVVERAGRFWCECVGERLNIGPGREEVRIYRGRSLTAYDGEVATSMSAGKDGGFHFGEIGRYATHHGVHPLEYTTRYQGRAVTEIMRRPGARVTGQESWGSRPVAVAETEPVTVDGKGWKYRFLVDMERGVVVRRASLILLSPDRDWRENTRIEASEYKEISPGIWLPMQVMYESVSTPKGDGPEELSWRFEGRNSDWAVNRERPAGLFRLEFPKDVIVTDHRKAGPAEAK